MSIPAARRKTTLSMSRSSNRKSRQRCRRPRRRSRMPRSQLLRCQPHQRQARRPRPRKPPPPPAELPPKIPPAASEPAAETRSPSPATGAGDGAVDARRSSDGLSLTFSFAAATPAALFRRADTVWLVFDSVRPIDIEPIRSKGGSIIADVNQLPLDRGQAIRIRLNRPQMPSLTGEDQPGGGNWPVAFVHTMRTPTQPLLAIRNIIDPTLANVTVPLSRPGL